jgi:hypothetical protein
MIDEQIKGGWNWKIILILKIISNKKITIKRIVMEFEGKTYQGREKIMKKRLLCQTKGSWATCASLRWRVDNDDSNDTLEVVVRPPEEASCIA